MGEIGSENHAGCSTRGATRLTWHLSGAVGSRAPVQLAWHQAPAALLSRMEGDDDDNVTDDDDDDGDDNARRILRMLSDVDENGDVDIFVRGWKAAGACLALPPLITLAVSRGSNAGCAAERRTHQPWTAEGRITASSLDGTLNYERTLRYPLNESFSGSFKGTLYIGPYRRYSARKDPIPPRFHGRGPHQNSRQGSRGIQQRGNGATEQS